MTRGTPRIIAALLGTLVGIPCARAQGGPPMITDDPGTPGAGHWEINLAATGRHSAFGSEAELPLLDINYGLGERMQLKYELPWVTVRPHEGDSRSGLGNSLLGVKARFVDGGQDGWQLSTYPQLQLRNPGSGSARRGLSEPGTQLLVPFEFQHAFQSFSVDFETGRNFRSRGRDEWIAGAVIGHTWSERLEAMAEISSAASESLDRSAVALNLGARVGIPDRGTLLLSVGRDLHNQLEERASVFGYLGWQITL